MKNIKLLLVVILTSFIFITESMGQTPNAYKFDTVRKKLYEPLTSPTIVSKTAGGQFLYNRNQDSTRFLDVVYRGEDTYDTISSSTNRLIRSKGFPIGFDFEFDNSVFDKFVIYNSGFITLGYTVADSVEHFLYNATALNTAAVFNNANVRNSIGICNKSVAATTNTQAIFDTTITEISYKLEGTSPNRCLVVQFSNIVTKVSTFLDTLSYQLRLYEGSNNVEMHFGKSSTPKLDNNAKKAIAIGLKGGSENNTGLFLGALAAGGSSWLAPPVLAANNTGFIQWNNTVKIPDSLHYTFKGPAPCATPTVSGSNMTFSNVTSNSLTVNFTRNAADGNIYKYLLLRTTTPTFSGSLANGTDYAVDSVIGNAVVAGLIAHTATGSTFNVTKLSGSTDYYFHVVAASYQCKGLPVYAASNNFLTGSQRTKGAPPVIVITKLTNDSIVLSITRNADNQPFIVSVTDSNPITKTRFDGTGYSSKYGGAFGNPVNKRIYAVDDELLLNNTIIAVSETNTTVVLKNLQPNKAYHFKAWSYNAADTIYSNYGSMIDTVTAGMERFYETFQYLHIAGTNDPALLNWTSDIGAKGNIAVQDGYAYNVIENPSNGMFRTVHGYIESPWIYTSASNSHQLTINASLFTKNSFDTAYTMGNRDSILIQISENGTNFTTLLKIDKSSAPAWAVNYPYTEITLPTPVTGYQSTKVKIRILIYNGDATALFYRIGRMIFEATPECTYPTNVVVSDILSGQCKLNWKKGDNETAWNVRYAVSGTNEWVEAPATQESYTFKNLPSVAQLKFQVQAVCSQISKSLWSDAFREHITEVTIPYAEAYANSVFPYNWLNNTAAKYIYDTTPTTGNLVLIPVVPTLEKVFAYHNSATIGGSKALFVNTTPKDTGYIYKAPFVQLPTLNFGDGSYINNLSFRATLTAAFNNATAVSDPNFTKYRDDARLAVFISNEITSATDEVVYPIANCIAEWKSVATIKALLSGKDTTLNISIKNYPGVRKIGIYFAGSDTIVGLSNAFKLGAVSIAPSCAPISNLTIDAAGTDSIDLSWDNNASGMTSWIVKVDKLFGDHSSNMTEVTEEQISIKNLEAGKSYLVKVSNVCSAGDTAQWISLPVSTKTGIPCTFNNPDFKSATTKNNATLTWNATPEKNEFTSYNYAFKVAGASSWINVVNVPDTTTVINLLPPGVAFEYKVQAVCTRAIGDTSTWSALQTFTTASLTCTTPYNAAFTEVGKKELKLSFSDSSKVSAPTYQISLLKKADSISANPYSTTAKVATFSNLEPVQRYYARLRSVCGANDTSVWTSIANAVSATTLPLQNCVKPNEDLFTTSGLTATSITLNWVPDASNLKWNLTYRSTDDTVNVDNLTEPTYTISNLTPNTSYYWNLVAICEDFNSDGTSWQLFKTQTTSIKNSFAKGFYVTQNKGSLMIANNANQFIEKIELMNVMGQVILQKNIRHSSDVVLTIPENQFVGIINIYGKKGEIATFKLIIK